MSASEIISILEEAEESALFCESIFCTTCGGLASQINKDHVLKRKLMMLTKDLEYDDFKQLGKWRELTEGLVPTKTEGLRRRRLSEPFTTSELDEYIYRNRYWVVDNPLCDELIEDAYERAITERNESLIESLLIVFKEENINRPEFIRVAVETGEDNIRRFGRVLYNILREKVPEVM